MAAIRASKLRYYEDRNFTGRVLPPPALATDSYTDRPSLRPDDWSTLVVAPAASLAHRLAGLGGTDEGGLRRQPELDNAEAVLPSEQDREASTLLDESDDESSFVHLKRGSAMTRAARLAALDPDDGIVL